MSVLVSRKQRREFRCLLSGRTRLASYSAAEQFLPSKEKKLKHVSCLCHINSSTQLRFSWPKVRRDFGAVVRLCPRRVLGVVLIRWHSGWFCERSSSLNLGGLRWIPAHSVPLWCRQSTSNTRVLSRRRRETAPPCRLSNKPDERRKAGGHKNNGTKKCSSPYAAYKATQ